MTVLSPYRHPIVTSHPIESQHNKRKGDEVTVIKQHPHTLLLLHLPETARPPAFASLFVCCFGTLLYQNLATIHDVDATLHLVQALAGEIVYL